MPTAVLNSPACYQVSTAPQASPYEAFGCEVNAIRVEELFARYGEIGFLYPEKLARLEPVMAEIKDNWQRALSAGDRLHRIVTYKDEATGAWASISSWRSTNGGWTTQHLVSAGNPVASRAVMLAEQQAEVQEQGHRSNQNWFRPENKMPKRIFGSIVNDLGADNAAVDCFNYVEVTPLPAAPEPRGFRSVEVTSETQEQLFHLAIETRGLVYARAEELASDDFNLAKLDAEYQEVGLRRYRRAWIVLDEQTGQALAGLIAYRGPLGFNFSFLENRCDLLVSPVVEDERLAEIVSQLIAAASAEYADFAPGFIPVIADDRTARVLQLRGDRFVRQYCQSVWLRAGYEDWYHHTERFYERIVDRLQKREERHAAVAEARSADDSPSHWERVRIG